MHSFVVYEQNFAYLDDADDDVQNIETLFITYSTTCWILLHSILSQLGVAILFFSLIGWLQVFQTTILLTENLQYRSKVPFRDLKSNQ